MNDPLGSTLTAWWWDTIAVHSLQGALVLGAVAALDLAFPKRVWPQVRLAMWTLALAKLAAPPSWGSPWGSWGGLTQLASAPVEWSDRSLALAEWIVGLWVVGVVLFLSAASVRYRMARRDWWRRTEARPDLVTRYGLVDVARRAGCRLPAVRWTSQDDAFEQGLVIGLIRPTVVVSSRLSSRDLEVVLLHELGHLRRRDLWWAAAELLLQAGYWFHPLVWWARQRTGVLREQSCDRFVAGVLAEQGEDPGRYRSTLLRLAAARWQVQSGLTGGLGFVRPRSGVVLRLALLQSFRAERVGARRLAVAAVLAGMVAFGWPAAHQAEQRVGQLAEVIRRPPGSLQLRYLVLQRLALEEQRKAAEKSATERKAEEETR